MHWRLTIVTILCLGAAYTAGAQDAIPVQLVKEQTSPVTGVRDEVYGSPALKIYQRQHTYSHLSASFRRYNQDLYLQQEGNGRQTFTVHSETYLKPKEQLTLWGQAYYSNEQIYQVRFNESADYHLVYPYVMADSVGGDLQSETYAFSGGLAKAVGPYQLGLTAGFRGEQSYRDRDPRPENISSEIDLALAASRKLGARYALALDLSGKKYNQKNRLSFVSELGTPFIYHDAGLGAYNDFLAGNRISANFNGFGYGAALHFSPLQYKGWFAHAGITQFELDKFLANIDYEISKVKESRMTGSFGYLYEDDRRHFIAQLKAVSLKRKGIEGKFNNRDSQNGVYKISEDIRYVYDYNAVSLRTVYGRTGGGIDWFCGLEAGFHDHIEQYVQPDRELSYNQVLAGIDITARRQFGKTVLTAAAKAQRQENLENNGTWNDIDQQRAIYSMLNSNFAFLTASGMNYGGSIRADFPLTARLSCFISANAGYHTGIGKRDFRILTAFQF